MRKRSTRSARRATRRSRRCGSQLSERCLDGIKVATVLVHGLLVVLKQPASSCTRRPITSKHCLPFAYPPSCSCTEAHRPRRANTRKGGRPERHICSSAAERIETAGAAGWLQGGSPMAVLARSSLKVAVLIKARTRSSCFKRQRVTTGSAVQSPSQASCATRTMTRPLYSRFCHRRRKESVCQRRTRL